MLKLWWGLKKLIENIKILINLKLTQSCCGCYSFNYSKTGKIKKKKKKTYIKSVHSAVEVYSSPNHFPKICRAYTFAMIKFFV